MGMDFEFAGSASYPRFDRELCAVAEVFGGVKTEHLQERIKSEVEGSVKYWFGFLSSDRTDKPKFSFPVGTNETIIKWFNNIYKYFTVSETRIIWDEVSKHPEIKDLSWQIWHELEQLVIYDSGWHIR